MTRAAPPASRTGRRLDAWLAVALLVATVAYVAVSAVSHWGAVAVAVGLLATAVLGGWWALSRRGPVRAFGVVLVVAGVIGFLVTLAAAEALRLIVVALLLASASVVFASRALGVVSVQPQPAQPSPVAARHGVLIMNLKSGGGKAERFALVDECRRRGIEPVVLAPGDDLRQLAEDAVARGADVLGMAGGDGSQALVASVAAAHDVPLVVVPAGTRNHFALDLGLDRDDVVGALDAFTAGVDRRIDLAEVNGRVFVNNASMGVYAKVVQSPEYRDQKVGTAVEMLPDIVGPAAQPLDLRFALPDGAQQPTAQLVLVSNNVYDLHHLRGGGTRARLDEGVLGIVSVLVTGAADAERLAALEAVGQVQRFRGWNEWTAAEFDVASGTSVEIGVDGEALVLDAPLRFRVRPGALVVRLPADAAPSSAAARTPHLASGNTVAELWRVARGRA